MSSPLHALILAGGHGTDLAPLTRDRPKHLLPIANRPALGYLLDALAASGLPRVGVTVNGDEGVYRDCLGDGSRYGVALSYLRELAPLGTAGCLRRGAGRDRNRPLLVMSANLFHALDLRPILEFHWRHGAAATVCVTAAPRHLSRRPQRESARVSARGELIELGVDYSKLETVAEWSPAGIYVFEPEALDEIPEGVYYDIKEQLIPELLRKRLPVVAHPLEGYHRPIDYLEDYLAVHLDFMRGRTGLTPPGEEIAEGVWVQGDAEVDRGAVLVGPLLLGPKVRIGDGARLIGPLVVGDGGEVGEGVLLRESVAGEACRIGRGARLQRCVVAGGARVDSGARLEESVVTDRLGSLGDVTLLERDVRIHAAAVPQRALFGARGRGWLYSVLKRTFDLLLASAALCAALPVMALVALAVKLDSKGSILYGQTRCGRAGRKFRMLKFRSMREDADQIKESLLDRNEADGPVFKITDDPRLTRVGRLLRRYSLDELPQLWNVLCGDMSVVGPRPLAEEELRLCPSWREARLQVKPGLTGLWQVSAREEGAFHNWIQHDLGYVRERSLLLDLKIVMRTVAALAKGL
jgi:lipopolysaccharide/colanic/teichoic acid biosynthesis glycosyltransferase